MTKILLILSLSIYMCPSLWGSNIDSLLKARKDVKSPVQELLIINELTEAYYGQNFPLSAQYGEEAKVLGESLNDQIAKARNSLLLSLTYYHLGKKTESLSAAEESLALAKIVKDKVTEADAYYAKGRALILNSRRSEALPFFQSCLSLSDSISYSAGLSKANRGIGLLVEYEGKFDEAIKLYNKALQFALESGYQIGEAHAFRDIGRVNDISGNYEEGLKYYLQGLRAAEKYNLTFSKARVTGNIASLHNLLKNYDKSIEFAKKAIVLFEECGNLKGLGGSTSTIGNVLNKMNKPNEALPYFEKVLKIRQEQGDKRGLSFAYANFGSSHKRLGNIMEAKKYYDKCLELREEIGFKFGISGICQNLAGLHMDLKEYDKAIPYLKRSLELAQEMGGNQEMQESYNRLAKCYEALDQAKLALWYLKLYNTKRDSMLGEDRNKQIAEMQILYESELKEKTILAKNNELLTLANKNDKVVAQRNYILGGTLLFGLMGFFGVRLRQSQREKDDKKEFAEALIYAQEEERKRIASDLHDGIGQSLLLIKKQIERTTSTTEENQELISQTLEEVRSISQDLHPFQLDKFGLGAALEETLQKVEQSHDLFITRQIDEITKGTLTQSQEINLYRTIQEAINNIIKHANATAMKLSLKLEKDKLKVIIQDNGKGFDDELALVKLKSLGLKTMKERIQNIGGNFKISKGFNGGTDITIDLLLKR